MKANRIVGCGQFVGDMEIWKRHKELWRKIAVDLNSIEGAIKTGKQWKKVSLFVIDEKNKKLYNSYFLNIRVGFSGKVQ